MNHPVRVEIRDANDRLCQMRRVCRPAALIVHHAQRVGPFVNLLTNRVDEVRTVMAKQPRCPEDDVPLRVRRCDFAQQFGAAIRREGSRDVVDFVWRMFATVEDEVAGDVHE